MHGDSGLVVGGPPNAQSPPSAADVRAQLERLLASPDFDVPARARRFLSYVVEETLAGRADRIKAYTVGTQVFARTADFDAQNDPAVRIEAGRLRRALGALLSRRWPVRPGRHRPSPRAPMSRTSPGVTAGRGSPSRPSRRWRPGSPAASAATALDASGSSRVAALAACPAFLGGLALWIPSRDGPVPHVPNAGRLCRRAGRPLVVMPFAAWARIRTTRTYARTA